MVKTILIATTVLWASAAYAEDVIIEHDRSAPPPSSTTTVEKHGPDCDTKSVHSENGEGDSKTVTRQDCD